MAPSTTTAITATARCSHLIRLLVEEHGAVSIHVSANYGMTVVCLEANALSLGSRDVLVGEIEGAPFYMMTSEIDLWEGSVLILDVADGVGPGFSLEGPRGVHFTLRKRAHPGKRSWNADAILAAGPPNTYTTGNASNE